MRCCSLIASVRTSALYALTAVLVAASAFAGMPRPLASAVAAEIPERAVAPVGLTVVAAVETTSKPSESEVVALAPPAAPAVQAVAAAENSESASAIEPTSFWAKTKRETAIWSGWDSNAKEFAKVASDLTLQVLEFRGPRAYVYFPGDNKGHKAGLVWMDRADLQDLVWPRWARARRDTILRATPSLSSEEKLLLQRGNYIETTGEYQGRWAQAFFLIDNRPGEWAVGWVDGLDLMLPRGEQTEISNYMLSRSTLMTSSPELWLKVPYRTQLDGSSYAEANCGPTSVAMALEAIGKRDSLESLRSAALKLQDSDGCDDCGTFIQHLAMVAEARGAKTYGLRDDPETFHRWSMDEIRQQLRQERVVIPQVKFRYLPGRTKSQYYGDHYIVIVGLSGQQLPLQRPRGQRRSWLRPADLGRGAGAGDVQRDRRLRAGGVRGRPVARSSVDRSQKSASRRYDPS